MTKDLSLPKTDGTHGGDVREDIRVLTLGLAAACKEDGRVAINGAEYSVVADHAVVDFLPEWAAQIEGECSIQMDPVFDKYYATLEGVSRGALRHLRYFQLIIKVDHTTSRWTLYPLGQSVPGQRRVEHQAGSPKPEPEIINPEENHDDEY